MSSSARSAAKLPHGSSPHLLTKKLAQERLNFLRQQQQEAAKKLSTEENERAVAAAPWIGDLPLIDFVPKVSPNLVRPRHLLPFLELLQRAVDPGELRAVVAAPPQHGKTEVVLHALL